MLSMLDTCEAMLSMLRAQLDSCWECVVAGDAGGIMSGKGSANASANSKKLVAGMGLVLV